MFRLLGRSLNDWGFKYLYTYVLLKKNSPVREVNKKISDLIKQNVAESNTVLVFQPVEDIHLYLLNGGGGIIYVYIMGIVALFVIAIASINFMNLTTAR